MNTKPFVRIAVLGMLVVTTSVAFAGRRAVYPVTVNDPGKAAYGTMADARGSTDGVQHIGCYHNATAAGCYATNAAGLARGCTTSDAGMMETIRHVTPESYIYFQWNADATCNYVLVDNGSRFKPAGVSGY